MGDKGLGITAAEETADIKSDIVADSVKEIPDEVPFTGEPHKTIVLETSRLTLRTLDHGDYDSLSVILRDPEVMYAYEHGFEEEEVKAWLERMLARYKQYGFALWAVILKETGQFIGQCGITMQEADGKQVMEVGYLFAKAFWHRGYAAEAAVACREYAFNSLGADAVYSIIREGNEASERVAKRNGMKNCGSVLKHYYNMDMPHNIYRITRGEWEIQAGMNTHNIIFTGKKRN